MRASPAAKSSSTPTAGWPGTVAAPSPARTRRRSTAPPRTPCAGWRRTWSPPGWRAAARCRSPTRSARRIRWASTSTASAPRSCRSTRSRRQFSRSSTCAPPPSSATSTCCGRSTPRPRRTDTSGVSSPSSPGSAPTGSRRSRRPRGSEPPAPPSRGAVDEPPRLSAAAGRLCGVVDEAHGTDQAGQLTLMPDLARARAREVKQRAVRAAKGPKPVDPAPELPVARVLVDVPLAHLDRPFDYLVPRKMHDRVAAGSRVKVRFAGQDVDGFVLERLEVSDHPGRLAPLRRAVSAEQVLTPEVARLSAAVAARYAGTRSDVLRLAVPPRHAAVEKEAPPVPPGEPRALVDVPAAAAAWSPSAAGPAFVHRLAAGAAPRSVWSALPGAAWPTQLAQAAAATVASGRGALLCVPD